ncbi:MAG TPA: aspartate aminotransferase family protein, partial [Ktedonobacterales bacterium]|nr:aspartate aminotransferase family protein [Ktedonobacterales bacterium]
MSKNGKTGTHATAQTHAARSSDKRMHALTHDREQYVPRGVFSYHPAFPASASGARVVDLDGNTFLDFAGGIGTMNVGHSHPAVVAAIQEQAAQYTHTCAHVLMPPLYVELARRLTEITPGNFAKKAMLVNSGAEAVENAVKIARAATGRRAIISFENSFHGRTNLALALTGKVRPYRQNFGPFASEVHTVPYPYCYQSGHRHANGESCQEWRDALERAFATRIPADQVAAVIVEPVQGEGGFVVPPPDFLTILREICSQNGILLIADEVQSGVGRTGKWWAVEHSDVEPDIVCSAKGIASGVPFGAMIARKSIVTWGRGAHGNTYGGNPLACAAGLETLRLVESGYMRNAHEVGEHALQALQAMATRHPTIGHVRGMGLMIGVEFVTDKATKEPAHDIMEAVVCGAYER